jgi:hypothetical protein
MMKKRLYQNVVHFVLALMTVLLFAGSARAAGSSL